MNAPRMVYSGVPKTQSESGEAKRGGYFALGVGGKVVKFTLEQTTKEGDYITNFDIKLNGLKKGEATAKITVKKEEVAELFGTKMPIGQMTMKWAASGQIHTYYIMYQHFKTTENSGWVLYNDIPEKFTFVDDGL